MNTRSEDEAVVKAAAALQQARASRRTIPQVSATFGLQGLEVAYAVADINTLIRQETGVRVVGKKVGLTSMAVQQQLGVDQPDFGVLFADMEYLNGQDVSTERLIQPKVEAEVAFVVGRDCSGDKPSWGEFLHAIAFAVPALEIVDSAIDGWKITLFDTVADNASSGLYVLGDEPVALGTLMLAELGMEMSKNGQRVSVGSGAACLGHPLRAAYWLACTMTARGQPLRAGEVILSGALGPMVPVQTGDLVQARIGALGAISCRMV
jgi:2-keto-4-pentenoate hydratase